MNRDRQGKKGGEQRQGKKGGEQRQAENRIRLANKDRQTGEEEWLRQADRQEKKVG